MPVRRKSDQSAARQVRPTGDIYGGRPDPLAQSGSYLTTAQGLRLPETDHSLARFSIEDPGVSVSGDVDNAFVATLAAALGLHRAWDRAPKVMASAVPPAGR